MLISGDARIIRTVRAVVADLDGVVYAGDRMLPGAVGFFALLQSDSIPYAFLTNNTTRTPEHYAERLAKAGIVTTLERIVTAAEATARLLARERPGARVYVIGEEGLRAAFLRRGFVLTAEAPDYVVVGLDRRFDYEKLRLGAAAIRRGAQFIASNADPLLPTSDDFIPGAGSMVGALVGATGVAPRLVGKPKPDMLLLAVEQLGVPPQDALMIGDRLDTDIAAGHAAGTRTALVLSGVARLEDLPAAPIQPDLVATDLAALAAAFSTAR
jgi:4-nitrophenyl phosphatase